ncbi:MAG: hypothetical protein PHH09_07645 [Methanoregulaceae archaeon]|nr:hypothetical protein [Methanoregulaceae archaeon]
MGSDDQYSSNLLANYVILQKYESIAPGSATQIRVKSGATGNIKTAIYSDADGVPGTRLAAATFAVVDGWITADISAVFLPAGYYWLGEVGSALGVVQREFGGTTLGTTGKTETYSTYSFPDQFDPTGSATSANRLLISVWGTLATGGTGRLIGGPGKHPLISGPGKHPLISCGGNALIG